MQATITVYQAVSEYWAAAQEPEYDLKVDIHLPGKALPDRLSFTRANHYTTRTVKVRMHNYFYTQNFSSCPEISEIFFPICVFFKFLQIPDINQDVKVTAEGSGEATLTVFNISLLSSDRPNPFVLHY